jgi:hypothetical protein
MVLVGPNFGQFSLVLRERIAEVALCPGESSTGIVSQKLVFKNDAEHYQGLLSDSVSAPPTHTYVDTQMTGHSPQSEFY